MYKTNKTFLKKNDIPLNVNAFNLKPLFIEGLLNGVLANQASFRWLQTSERSSKSGIPVFAISFPDGNGEDFAELENSFGAAETDCIFGGFLNNEPDVLVSVNGCPFSDHLDVSQTKSIKLNQKSEIKIQLAICKFNCTKIIPSNYNK